MYLNNVLTSKYFNSDKNNFSYFNLLLHYIHINIKCGKKDNMRFDCMYVYIFKLYLLFFILRINRIILKRHIKYL